MASKDQTDRVRFSNAIKIKTGVTARIRNIFCAAVAALCPCPAIPPAVRWASTRAGNFHQIQGIKMNENITIRTDNFDNQAPFERFDSVEAFDSRGNPVQIEEVVYRVNDEDIGTLSLDADGKTQITLTGAAGSVTVTAEFDGDPSVEVAPFVATKTYTVLPARAVSARIVGTPLQPTQQEGG